MPDDRFLVVFGETEVAEGIVTWSAHHSIEEPSSARVVISNEVLVRAAVDYQAEVRLYLIRDSERHALFTGVVDAVIPADGATEIRLASGAAPSPTPTSPPTRWSAAGCAPTAPASA